MDPDTLQNLGAAGAAGVAGALGIAAGAAGLRKRLSRDETGRAKDEAEREIMSTLLAERDQAMADAREAQQARQDDVHAIARLSAQNTYQQEEINRLIREFESMRRRLVRLYPPTRAYLESGYVDPVDMPGPPAEPPQPTSPK